MVQYFCLYKKITKEFNLIISDDMLDSIHYYIFFSREDAFLFWRSFNLSNDIAIIDNVFKETKDKGFFYHIFINIHNIKTNKIIQYLLAEINYLDIMNKMKRGYNVLKSLGEDFSLTITYGKEKRNRKSYKRMYNNTHDMYLGATDLYKIKFIR